MKKSNLKAFLLFLLLAVIARFLTSCVSPYMIVQRVDGDIIHCKDSKGIDKHTKVFEGELIQRGDTLMHVGGYRYYNISSK